MFFMKDAAQQALDINIGRVLEMFRTGVLNRQQTCEGLTRFLKAPPIMIPLISTLISCGSSSGLIPARSIARRPATSW